MAFTPCLPPPTTMKASATASKLIKIQVHGKPPFYDGSSTRLEPACNGTTFHGQDDLEVESLDDSFHTASEETYRMVTTMRKYNKKEKEEKVSVVGPNGLNEKAPLIKGSRYAVLALEDNEEEHGEKAAKVAPAVASRPQSCTRKQAAG